MMEAVIVACSDNRNRSGPTASLRLADTDRRAPARVIRAGIGFAILRRVDHAGRDQVEAHAVRRDLLGRALRECDQRCLARGIGRRTRPALVREAGREGNDAARPARDHAGNHRLVAPDDAGKIDPQHPLPLRRVHLVHHRPRLNRRRTNEAVDPAKFPFNRGEGREHLRAIGDIEAPRCNPGNIGQGRHGRRVDVADDDASAGPCGRARQGEADSICTAGDDDHISLGLEARAHGQETFAAIRDDSKPPRPARVAVSTRLFTVWASRRQTSALPCRVAQTSSPGA